MYVRSTVLCVCLVCLSSLSPCATFNLIFAVAFETFHLGVGGGLIFRVIQCELKTKSFSFPTHVHYHRVCLFLSLFA